MDDAGKAFVMAGQVLMFVLAITISIVLYNRLNNAIDEIFLTSNFSNQGDSITDLEAADSTRDATKAEVVMAILDLKNKYEDFETDDYEVIVNGVSYTYDSATGEIAGDAFNSFDLYNRLTSGAYIPDGVYRLTYSQDGKILRYTLK